MGEKDSMMRLFRTDTGEEIAVANDIQIHLSNTEEEEKQSITYHMPEPFEITCSVALSPQDSEHIRDMFIFSRDERKKMFHAVTHGQVIMFDGIVHIEGREPVAGLFYIDKPRVLRRVLALSNGMRFHYSITTADCCALCLHLDL